MSRWTDPKNLRENDRIQTRDGSTVTGKRDGSGEDYRAVVPDGQRVKKII